MSIIIGSCLATKIFILSIGHHNDEQRSITNKIVMHLMHPNYCQITIAYSNVVSDQRSMSLLENIASITEAVN